MTARKLKPIIRGNIIVWPHHPPIAPQGVTLACQRMGGRWPANVHVLPVYRNERKRPHWMDEVHLKPNDIGVVRATMRNQRYDARYEQAQERLHEIFNNPASFI